MQNLTMLCLWQRFGENYHAKCNQHHRPRRERLGKNRGYGRGKYREHMPGLRRQTSRYGINQMIAPIASGIRNERMDFPVAEFFDIKISLFR
jgi:hypothetical protein